MAHEIMENDGLFSVGETPWHGLGEVLDSPPTVEEGISKAKLDWTVTLMPCFARVPMGENQWRGIEIPHQAVRRDDTGDILGVVGQAYQPLQNRDAFGLFAPLVEDKSLLLETAGSLKNGRRVWVLARINTDGAEIVKGDEVKPYVMLSNSHDGTMAVRFGFTPVRVVCNNTLSAAVSSDQSQLMRIIHSGQLYGNLEALRGLLNLTTASFQATVEQYRWLAGREINQADLDRYVRIVLRPEMEQELKAAQEKEEGIELPQTPTIGKIVRLFESGRGAGLPAAKTWWGAYNAVNEWLMYERGHSDDNRLNSAWFADGYEINQRALNTAIRLAA